MEAYFTGGNSFLALQAWPKLLTVEVIGPSEDSSEDVTVIVLPNEPGVKLTPKCLFITIDQCCF